MFSQFLLRMAAPLLAIFAATPALATWYEASSDNFIIYADSSEEEVRLYAENLERYHSAMEHFTGREVAAPSPSNRITVYANGSANDIRNLAGVAGIAGFYLPRTDGSLAFVQDIENKEGYPDLSTVVLLHEYAHHFLSSTDRFAMPLWMNEGAAEFFSGAFFKEDGSVILGVPYSRREFTIFWIESEMTSVTELLQLDWDQLKGRPNKDKNSFYGRSWLLYHYLSTTEERAGQLREYWLQVLGGKSSLEAAQDVFGNFGMLERQLNRHYRDRSVRSHLVEAEEMSVSVVTVRALDDAEAAIMPIRIEIERGTDAQRARELAQAVRAIAIEYPDNAATHSLLSQSEHAAGNFAGALEAAQAALAIDPDNSEAHMLHGKAAFRLARDIADPELRLAAYQEAMKPFEALNSLEPDHTVPLIYSYRFFAEQNLVPSEASKQALTRAAELAPFDQDLWLIVGMMHLNDGRIADAKAALQPLASNPHGGNKAEQVRNLLAFLSDKEEGRAIPVQAAIADYFLTE